MIVTNNVAAELALSFVAEVKEAGEQFGIPITRKSLL